MSDAATFSVQRAIEGELELNVRGARYRAKLLL